MIKRRIDDIKDVFDKYISQLLPSMKYKGRAMQIGQWEMDEMVDLNKSFGDDYTSAIGSRIIILIINENR